MTPDSDPPTPLELATAARVSCHLLEEEIADQIRKPTQLRAKRLTDRCQQLWQRIDALAARIEDQHAEIERLPLLLSPRVDLPACEASDRSDTSDRSDLSDAGPPLPSAPAPITTPRCGDARPVPDLGVRPPGFQEVRRRMQRHGRRTDAIDRIKAVAGEGDHVPRRGRTNATEWKIPQKTPPPWKRFMKAVEDGRLPVGQALGVGDISRAASLSSTQLQNVQADLIIEGAPYRIQRSGHRATITRI